MRKPSKPALIHFPIPLYEWLYTAAKEQHKSVTALVCYICEAARAAQSNPSSLVKAFASPDRHKKKTTPKVTEEDDDVWEVVRE
jgi:hypothetical protein